MEGDLVRTNEWLTPLSWLYGMGVALRNALFDMDVLESRSYKIPVICVGNLTVGGTGKTPHTEYLLRLLSPRYKVAVLSRGYKRKTSGYILATEESTVEEIGDEPWQMKQKFPDIYVAVDKNRREGIERLCDDPETCDVEVILLDDAFQHRYVKPGLSILLIDYHRMVTDDRLLPVGRLREPMESMNRANIVVVTKCPHDIKPMDYRVIQKALGLKPYQDLFFSTFRYGKLWGLFHDKERKLSSLAPEESVLLLTGIASPEQLHLDLRRHTQRITSLSYPDHHNFTPYDIRHINHVFASLPSPRIIITTEKDATRLLYMQGLSREVKESLYILPIRVDFLRDEQDMFNEKISGYVLKNSRNRFLAKNQDDDDTRNSHHTGHGTGTTDR